MAANHVSKLVFRLLSFAGVLLTSRLAGAELLPAIPDFNVGTDLSSQEAPAIAGLSGGRFVVAWYKGSPLSFVARVFDKNGTPLTAEIPITGPMDQIHTSSGTEIAAIPPGDSFVVAWQRSGDPVGASWRVYQADGTPQTPEMLIDEPDGPVLAGIAASSTRISILSHAWDGFFSDPATNSVLHLRIHAIDGTPIAGPIVVDEDDSTSESIEVGNQTMAVTMASDGSSVVVWIRYDLDGGGLPTGILRRYDASGIPIGSDLIFAEPMYAGSVYAQVAADAVGRIYLRWHSGSEDHLLRFNLDGSSPLDYPGGSLLAVSPEGRVVGGLGGLLQRWAADGSVDGPGVFVSDYLLQNEYATGAVIDSQGSVVLSMARAGGWPNYLPQARVRRFCDTTDPTCSICPAFDDTIDSDGDEVPDGCDPCSLLDPGQIASEARTSVSYDSNGYLVGKYNQVQLKQDFVLPPGVTFGDLSVMEDGARVRIENDDGAAVFDETLPGGAYGGRGTAGWAQKAGRILYRDSSDAPVNGIRKMTISGGNSRGVDTVRVGLRAKGGAYALSDVMPMKTIVVLGGPGASIAGACSITAYEVDDCEIGSGRRRCRQR